VAPGEPTPGDGQAAARVVEADRGSLFACPECGRACKAHDFAEFRWRHLNFFQHHGYITARVPRTDCPDHGVNRVQVPWAREGSGFTLLLCTPPAWAAFSTPTTSRTLAT
jgi:transposase